MTSAKNSISARKEILLNTIGKIIKKYRIKGGKGILLHAYEYDVPSSSLYHIEHGNRDPQLSTLWKIVNSLGLSFGEFISELEKELPEDFTLLDED